MNAFARLLRWLALAWLLMASWSAHAVIDTNKSYNPINRNVGQTATLIISIFNSDPVNSATAASFTDTMPAGMSVSAVLSNSCGGTATATGTQLTLTGGTVPNASGSVSGACSVAAVVTALSPGTHVNTLVRTDVTANAPGPIIAEADALATMTVNPLARPTGTKAVAVDPDLHGGGTRAFVITLSNSNAIALTNVGFTDTLPASLRIGTGGLVTNSCGGSVLDLGGGALDDGDTGLRLTGGTIPVSGSCSISFVFRPANNGAISNGGGGANTNSIPAGGVSTAEGVTNSAAISGTVNLRTGGAVGKGFSPSTITEGGLSTLTLTLTNRNLFTATAVDFTDAMPAGVTVQNLLSNSCGGSLNSFPSGTVTLTGGTIPAVTDPNSSGSASCAIVVQVTAPTAGNYPNTIAAGSFGAFPLSHGAASATLRVIPPSPVSVSKAFAPATVVHTGTSLLTITLNNAGGVPAAITSFTDNLLTMGNLAVRIAATPTPTTNCGGTLTATAGTTTISLTGGTIPASGNCQITVPVQAEPNGLGGNRTNTLPPDSLVTSVGNNENTATAALTINAALTAAKAFSPATITPSGTSRLTVTINHANGAPPFTNLSFIDNLPAGHTVAAPPDVFSTCGGTVTANAGSATFNLGGGFLPAGTSSCVVAVTIQAPAGTGAATNTIISGSVTTAEGVRSRAAASATLTRVSSGAPVTLNKSFLPTSINGGATSTLQITIANNNPGALALSGVALTDVMPTGMALAATPNPSFTGAGCTSATFVAVPLAGSVSFSGASIAANSVCNVTVVVTGLQDGNLTNNIPVSQLTSAQGVTNDNAPSATLTVLRNVGISKYFQPDTIVQGGTATLVIAVLNTNDVARTGTPTNTFTDNLPAGVTLASGVSTNSCAASSLTDGAGGALNAGDTSVRLNGGNFPAGSVCTLSVVVTSVTAGTVDNVIPPGSVTTLEGSTNPDPATARLRVLAPPTIAKSFNPTSLASAQPSTLTFTLGNPNSAALLPGGLTGAQFTDSLPAGLTVTLSGPAAGSCVGASGNLLTAGANSLAITGLTIPAAGSCTVALLVNAGAVGVYPNQSSGVITTLLPTASAPSNTATLTVLAAPSQSKSISPATILSGGTGTAVLTITLSNPNTTVVNLASPAVTDAFPGSPGTMTVASPLTTSNTCGGTLQDSGGGALAAADVGIRLTGGSLAASGTCAFSVVVLAPTPGLYLNTTSVLDTVNAGSAPAATASLTVTPSAHLEVTKTNSETTLTAGQSTTYVITVTNLGPASGAGTTVMDPAASGLDCTTLSCSASGGAVCPAGPLDVPTLQGAGYLVPTLPASSSVSFSLGCTVTATGE
jgi:uncharacterized repeat protein (TIGR01451 family)